MELEEAERKNRRALWTLKAFTFMAWVAFIVSLMFIMKKGMHHRSNIDDMQVEQLAIVALNLIEPKPRDNAVLEEQFQAALPTAWQLVKATRDFLEAKSEEPCD